MSSESPSEKSVLEEPRWLSIHVEDSKDAEDVARAVWKGRLPEALHVNLANKVQIEIGHWVSVLLRLSDPDQAHLLGRRTRQTFEGMGRESIARSIRSLRALEAFLIDPAPYYEFSLPPWRKKVVRRLMEPSGDLFFPAAKPGWRISAALLLIRAIAWSQSGWNQPYLWEAYSAIHARQDHEAWLQPQKDPAVVHAVKLLAYLIRFQSAPGQLVRGTGDAGFLEAAEELRTDKKKALTLLAVVAWALDFRNRELTPRSRTLPDSAESELVRIGIYVHEETDWTAVMEILEDRPARGRLKTWSYTKWLTAKSGSLRKFEKFQELVEKSVDPDKAVTFSFGRDYRSPQHRDAMMAAVRKVVEGSPKPGQPVLKRLEAHFDFPFPTLQVPLWNDPEKGTEQVTIIRLPAEAGAAYAVFDLPPTPAETMTASRPRAWSIFLHLYQLGKRKDHIREGFCPTALIGRFLEVCHAIAPEDCVSIPIRVNEQPLDFIFLPRAPESTPDESEEVRILARYVPTFILNRIMTHDIRSCDVALGMLDDGGAGPFRYGGPDADSPIAAAFRENSFDLLLRDYLNDFRAEPSAVDVSKGSFDLFSQSPRRSETPRRDLLSLLDQPRTLAGIDVGGTFTKIQLYKMTRTGEGIAVRPLVKGKPPVKILTGFGPTMGEKGETLTRRRRVAFFAAKVAEEIRGVLASSNPRVGRVDGVGVAWPGPVRDNRIQGTSGVLRKLGFSGQMVENKISEIMSLPLASSLAEAIYGAREPVRSGSAATRPVALLNDGDAHALAALHPSFLSPKSKAGRGVVVKLGTGTAGASVTGGNVDRGLLEFGKILVNLDYEPAGGFPRGVATDYVSAKALRGYAIKKGLPKIDPELEAVEIGLLAEIAPLKGNGGQAGLLEVMKRLRWQSGAIKVAELLGKISGSSERPLDVAELNKLEKAGEWGASADVRTQVVAALGILEVDLKASHARFLQRITEYGTHRLRKVLNLEGGEEETDFQAFLENAACLSPVVLGKIQEAAGWCLEAIEELGDRLADLLALLNQELRMDYAVLGGGVMSDATGTRVVQRAIERFEHYSWLDIEVEEATGDNKILWFRRHAGASSLSRMNPTNRRNTAEESDIDDYGTGGAALWGALEFVRQVRLVGLQLVSRKVQALPLMEHLYVERVGEEPALDWVRTGEGDPDAIKLSDFGLDARGVQEYLDDSARVLGVVRTFTDHGTDQASGAAQDRAISGVPKQSKQIQGPKYVYTRWLGG